VVVTLQPGLAPVRYHDANGGTSDMPAFIAIGHELIHARHAAHGIFSLEKDLLEDFREEDFAIAHPETGPCAVLS
jgi:hypothetical protein